MKEETDAPTRRRNPKDDDSRSVQARRAEGDDIRHQPPARTMPVAAFGMKEFIEWAIEAFGEPAKVLSSQRFALDKIMQRERGAKTPADVLKNVMQVIGDKGREQAGKSFGSYYGVANGGLEVLEFFFAVRGITDWQKRLTAPSTKLNEAESALMAELAEGKEDLTVPPDATIKTCPLLKKTMAKLGLRGDEGIARAKMIIGRAAQVREQAEAFAKTQAAIAAKRSDADYQKLLADGAFAEAMKMLQKAGATGDEARDAAKSDLKAVYLGTEKDEDLEVLVMMIPGDVLGEAEAAEWAKERTQAQKKAESVKAKPAKKAKKPAPVDPVPACVESAPEQSVETIIEPVVADDPPAAPAVTKEEASTEEVKSDAPPPASMPEETRAPADPEEPAPAAQVEPVDDIATQLMNARKRELLAKSKKELRKRCAELEIAVPPEVNAATGDLVEGAKQWLANQIIAKEFAAAPVA